MLEKRSVPGHLRLADFGLSRRLERGGRAFTICGTIQYMGELPQPPPPSVFTLDLGLSSLDAVKWARS